MSFCIESLTNRNPHFHEAVEYCNKILGENELPIYTYPYAQKPEMLNDTLPYHLGSSRSFRCVDNLALKLEMEPNWRIGRDYSYQQIENEFSLLSELCWEKEIKSTLLHWPKYDFYHVPIDFRGKYLFNYGLGSSIALKHELETIAAATGLNLNRHFSKRGEIIKENVRKLLYKRNFFEKMSCLELYTIVLASVKHHLILRTAE